MKISYAVMFDTETHIVTLEIAPSQTTLDKVPSEFRQEMADTLRRVADNLDRMG